MHENLCIHSFGVIIISLTMWSPQGQVVFKYVEKPTYEQGYGCSPPLLVDDFIYLGLSIFPSRGFSRS